MKPVQDRLQLGSRPGAPSAIHELSASELTALIRCRVISPVEAVDAYLDRIVEYNDAINAYVTVLPDAAREAARTAEHQLMSGQPLGALHGIPVAIKDIEPKAGVRNTCGSRALADFVADHDAPHVRRLTEAGAIVLGTTNVPEFGHKGTTDNLLVGPTSTPFAPGRNAGGSSGGSAAAVAAQLAALAQGSDGGGSVRIPASLSGVYGFIGTAGRIGQATQPNAFHSRAHFLHVGVLARTVADGALLARVLSGYEPADPFSLPANGTDWEAEVGGSVDGMRIAYSPNLDVFPVEPAVEASIRAAVLDLEQAGARVEEVGVGITVSQRDLSASWRRGGGVEYAVMMEHFKAQGLDLLGEHRDELTSDLIAYVELGRSLSAVEYRLDDLRRSQVFHALQGLFDRFDLLVTPTLAITSIPNAKDGTTVGPTEVVGEEVDPLIGWCLTYPVNFTGHPAASVPAAFTEQGLPLGVQLIAPRFAEPALLRVSAALERMRPWRDRYRSLDGQMARQSRPCNACHRVIE